MSYFKAKDCFNDNIQILRQPQGEELMWNLSTGLYELAEAIESDSAQIQGQLNQIAQALQRLK